MPRGHTRVDNWRSCESGWRLRVRPLRRDYGMAATLPATACAAELKLLRIRNCRIVAMVCGANTASVRWNGSRSQRERNEVSGDSKQQQKSGHRALHRFR